MIAFWVKQQDKLLQALMEHLVLTAQALAISLALAALLTLVAMLLPRTGQLLMQVFSVLYAVPSMALLALMIPFTGLGQTTALIVLVVYNQYLLLRSFIEGLRGVDAAVQQAALGMGMTRLQMLWRVQLPLALPSIFTGIRLAIISTVSIATIAAVINAGGLGRILFDGLRTLNTYKILWGSILSCVLALGLDGLCKLAMRLMQPKQGRSNPQ